MIEIYNLSEKRISEFFGWIDNSNSTYSIT